MTDVEAVEERKSLHMVHSGGVFLCLVGQVIINMIQESAAVDVRMTRRDSTFSKIFPN